MLPHTVIFFMSCTITSVPDLLVPSDTLVLRESLNGPGPERTGNWWGRFDGDGCWWEAHNTWLVVTDPVLVDSPAHPLHWNAVEPDKPWFCIEQERLDELKAIAQGLPEGSSGNGYVYPVDRWTVVSGAGIHSHVVYRGLSGGRWSELIEYFDELSSVSIWGQSPEN